jgi:hypothetical protein
VVTPKIFLTSLVGLAAGGIKLFARSLLGQSAALPCARAGTAESRRQRLLQMGMTLKKAETLTPWSRR